MSGENAVVVTLPADVQQIDQSGYLWAFLDGATEPDRVHTGLPIVAGDAEEPFLAHVVDITDGPGGRSIVHLDVVGIPDQAIDELRDAHEVSRGRVPDPTAHGPH